MRQTFSGWVAAFAVVALGAGTAPAMACGGGGLLTSPCSPCGQAYVSPCGQSYYGGYGHAGYGHYQRLAVPSPQYFWVNQGPVYDGPGQFAPRPYYQERTVTGWRGHYGYTGGPYANPVNHYSYGGEPWRGPAITSYRWRGHARPASLRYGYRSHVSHRHAVRPGLRYDAGVRYGVSRGVRSSVRYGHAPHAMHHGGHAHHAMHHGVQRMASPRVRQAPRFRDSGSYSYRSGFHQAPRAHRH